MAKASRENSEIHQGVTKSSKTPLLLALGGVVILMIVAFFAFQNKPSSPYTPEVSGRASLKANKEKVDLGDIKLGTPVQVSFELKNVGDKPLQFSKPPYVELIEGC